MKMSFPQFESNRNGITERKCTCLPNAHKVDDMNGCVSTNGNNPTEGMVPEESIIPESSYIHLQLPMTSSKSNFDSNSPNNNNLLHFSSSNDNRHAGFLDSAQHTSALVKLGEGDFSTWDLALCQSCVERVSHAVEVNTHRILAECQAYVDTVRHEEDRIRRMKGGTRYDNIFVALNISLFTSSSIEPYNSEIESLETEYQSIMQEIQNLHSEIYKENESRTKILTEMEDELLNDYNSLEIATKNNRNLCRTLSSEYLSTKKELDLLSKFKLHSLFFTFENEQVKKRTGGYDMINGLRLGFRPSKDLQWREINSAWSLVAQLVLFINNYTKFSSNKYRIAPLTSCAKIIEIISPHKKMVHHLGRDLNDFNNFQKGIEPDALRVLNSLFYSLALYTHKKYNPILQETRKQPFSMDESRIGVYDLTQVQDTEDEKWLGVIHCLTENMKWLLECVSFL